jgi:hypothetical protein
MMTSGAEGFDGLAPEAPDPRTILERFEFAGGGPEADGADGNGEQRRDVMRQQQAFVNYARKSGRSERRRHGNLQT